MRAFYRIWGMNGHRQKASWQNSIKLALDNGLTIETWCFDRTGTHDYVDVEISSEQGVCVKASDLFNELESQLSDGLFECCNYGEVEKMNYTFYWSNGCPTNKDFNISIGTYEDILNNYCFDIGIIPYIEPGTSACFKPVFSGHRFTVIRGNEMWN